MTAVEHVTGIGDDMDQGERHALELADRIRMVAAQDPALAQDIVDRLIQRLDEATGGTFRDYLDDGQRSGAEPVVVSPRSGEKTQHSSVRNTWACLSPTRFNGRFRLRTWASL